MSGRMYSEVTPWNVFKGCEFDCVYCKPSFQAQAKRQKHNCMKCYNFEPHTHAERLNKLPNGQIIWPGSSGDIAFSNPETMHEILKRIYCYAGRTFYLQSKDPSFFIQYLPGIAEAKNLILLTTLETNRDAGYSAISKAPPPSVRARDFAALQWSRKIVTIEPVMDFDGPEFEEMIRAIHPEMVYFGYNSRPKAVKLPEPDILKTQLFIENLERSGIPVKTKFINWETK